MKWWWILIFSAVLVGAAGIVWFVVGRLDGGEVVSPVAQLVPRPLDKYTIENLSSRQYDSQLILDQEVATASAFASQLFHFNSDGKRVNGLAHIPNNCVEVACPVVVQFRGYVDVETYQPGVGTKRSAEMFAQNGFISLAPDFLGYGGSDNPSQDIFEARFETYTTALNLLSAVGEWEKSNGKIFIWGHSNGGQMALAVLAISQKDYPTALWAPVSKPFPYSILYYTDEAEDKGKLMRKRLAGFESNYDALLYDPTRYFDRIRARLQIHQGMTDDAVPYFWSRELVKSLQDKGVNITYFEYPRADHDLSGSWDIVVSRDVQFFQRISE